ncbi:MAG: transposase [Rubrimonas sp.]
MKYDPERHHRRSIRLKGYDYSQPGAYFVTICTQDRACLFGEVVDGVMQLSGPGRMVETVWHELPHFYPGVDIDGFVVMPNHIHGIVVLVGAALRGRPAPRGRPHSGQARAVDSGQPRGHDLGQPQGVAPTGPIGQPRGHHLGQPRGVAPTMSLPDVVRRFKTLTSRRYADGVHQWGWMPFPGRLWQRNYYEHIIRSEESLNRIRQYILDNPMRWSFDRENPAVTAPEPENAWAQ